MSGKTRWRYTVLRRWFRRDLIILEIGHRYPIGISSSLAGTTYWRPALPEDLIKRDATPGLETDGERPA